MECVANYYMRLALLVILSSMLWSGAQGSSKRQSRGESTGLQLVKTTIASDLVVIFSKSHQCPLCVLVFTMFKQLGEVPVVVNLDEHSNGGNIERGLREVLLQNIEAQGRGHGLLADSIVPQVFIDGEHVGGFPDMLQLYESGNLEKLLTLKQAGG